MFEKDSEEPSEHQNPGYTSDGWDSGHTDGLWQLNSVQELLLIVGDVTSYDKDASLLQSTNMPYGYFKSEAQKRMGLDVPLDIKEHTT
jgi:hypothetical protein